MIVHSRVRFAGLRMENEKPAGRKAPAGGREGSAGLFCLFDLGDGDQVLVPVLGEFALDGDLHGRGTKIFVERLADIAGEEIGGGRIAILHLNDILAGVGFLEFALGTGAGAGEGDVLAFIGMECEGASGQSGRGDEFEELVHVVFGGSKNLGEGNALTLDWQVPFMITPPFTGGVLAGGLSRRMGRSKSRLTVDGEPLLQRQLRLLKEAGAEHLLVSLHPGRLESLPKDSEAVVVVDRVPDAGPLAGLERLLSAARTDWLLVVAVDLPCLDVPFLRRLWKQGEGQRGVVPEVAGRLEPLAAWYPRSAHVEAATRLARRELSLQDFVRSGLEIGWMERWPLHGPEVLCLTNWNEPAEFEEN